MTAKEKYERIKFMHEIREKAKKIRAARTLKREILRSDIWQNA